MNCHSVFGERESSNREGVGFMAREAQARSADKRERILRAAIKVFAEKGFFQAKISEIAKTANVADGTIYLYFDNKDDLLIQVFEEVMDRFLEGLGVSMKDVEGPVERIRLFLEHHLSMVETYPDVAAVISVELRQSHKFMKEYKNPKFAQYLTVLADIVRDGAEEGVFRSDINPWMSARALFGMLDELVVAWVLGRSIELKKSANQIFELFLHGVQAAPAKS